MSGTKTILSKAMLSTIANTQQPPRSHLKVFGVCSSESSYTFFLWWAGSIISTILFYNFIVLVTNSSFEKAKPIQSCRYRDSAAVHFGVCGAKEMTICICREFENFLCWFIDGVGVVHITKVRRAAMRATHHHNTPPHTHTQTHKEVGSILGHFRYCRRYKNHPASRLSLSLLCQRFSNVWILLHPLPTTSRVSVTCSRRTSRDRQLMDEV